MTGYCEIYNVEHYYLNFLKNKKNSRTQYRALYLKKILTYINNYYFYIMELSRFIYKKKSHI